MLSKLMLPENYLNDGLENSIRHYSSNSWARRRFSGSGKWFEMQDLHIVKVLPETLPLSEAYIQIFERRRED